MIIRTACSQALALLLVAAAGCASSGAASGGGTATPATAPRASAPAGTVAAPADDGGARAQKAFEDAVRAQAPAGDAATDWAAAERRWRGVLAQGELAEARFNLGVALEKQGRADEARAAYEQALVAKPALRQAAVNLAVLAETRGDVQGAAAAYSRVLRDFPEDALARERLGALYLVSSQYDEAWRLAREALLRDPRSVGSFKVLARAAVGKREYDLARLVARRAEKLAPKDAELPAVQGEAWARQGDAAAAAAQFRRALALDPKHLPSRYALLDQALRGEQWGAVSEHAQAILAQRPDDARVVLARGVALRHLGKPDEAMEAYARAEQLAGAGLPEVRLARGVLYARVRSECEPAITELTAYLKSAAAVANATTQQATKLVRDCEQMLDENKKAMEAAAAMKAQADRKAADAAARKAAEEALAAPPPPAPPSPAPAPPPEGAPPAKP